MPILSALLCTVLVCQQQKPKQSDFVPTPDTLGKERQEFYQAIASQLNASMGIKARVNLQAPDTLGTAWKGNDDGDPGETFIFPAGHSDRLYVTGINPGWNAEQNLTYNSITCFARVNGKYATVWTVDWRDQQAAIPPANTTGLSKLVGFDSQRIDNKFINPELARVRPYAVYKHGKTDSPWTSEFFDEQGTRAGARADDAGTSLHSFNTLVEESDYLTHHP